jgi:predicted nuclease of predicted toxin-antitoxin system
VNVKLLLDENISPKLAAVLCGEGIDACSARDRGLLRATDPEVFARAFAEERIVVTANVRDFEKLARSCELHAGMILFESGDLLRQEQLDLIRRAVVAITERGDLVNTALRVALDGAMTFEQMPSPS